jgi:hypothetical protein
MRLQTLLHKEGIGRLSGCPSVREADITLDAASYDSTRDTIIGVRGSYIYIFDANTLDTISQSRFDCPGFSPSHVLYAAAVDKVYVTMWNDSTRAAIAPTGDWPNSSIYEINPSTLAVEVQINFNTYGAPYTPNALPGGAGEMIYVGGYIFTSYRGGFNSTNNIKLNTNPMSPNNIYGGDSSNAEMQLVDVGGNSFTWFLNYYGQLRNTTLTNGINYTTAVTFPHPPGAPDAVSCHGLTYEPGGGYYYVGFNNQYIGKVAASAGAS